MNLLEETLAKLEDNGVKESDIIWCGSEDFGWFTWDDFKVIANIEYDCGFGSQKIAQDLIICGKRFWLERGEYDGSEWWEFKKKPKKPRKYKKPTALTIGQAESLGREVGCGWENLIDLNLASKK